MNDLEMQAAFHIALRSAMRLGEVLAAPAAFDQVRRVVTIKTKSGDPGAIALASQLSGEVIERATP